MKEVRRGSVLGLRRVGAALAAAAAVPLADRIVASTLATTSLTLSLTASAVFHATCVGVIVGVFSLSILRLMMRTLFHRIGWKRSLKGALILAIGTAIGHALSDPLGSITGRAGSSLLNIVLQGAFSGLLAMWLLGFARSEPGLRSNAANSALPAQTRVGIALLLITVAMALVSPVERLTAWHQGHNTRTTLELARSQRHLALGLSEISSFSAAEEQPNAELDSRIATASDVAHKQSRLLLNLLSIEHEIRPQFSSRLVAAYSHASAATNAMTNAAEQIRSAVRTSAQEDFQKAGAAHLAAVDAALAILAQEHELDVEIAAAGETIRELAAAAACAFLILVVGAPTVRATQRQRMIALKAWRDARRAEARVTTLRETLDQHFAMTITGIDGRIREANARFSQLTGYSREELLGNSYEMLSSNGYPTERLEQIWAAVLSGEIWRGEFCDRRKDGSLVWVESIVAPLRNEKGIIDSCITIGTDVTAIRRQAMTLQAMIDNFPGGILLIDKDQKIMGHNELYRKYLDLPVELFEETDATYADILRVRATRGDYGQGDLSQQIQSRLELMLSGMPHEYERADQHGHILEVRSAPIAGGGRLTTYFDVTERHNGEIELKRAHGRLEAFIKHAPAAVAMFDREMRYVAHSDRWLQDYGLCGQNLIGRSHYEVFPEIPDHWKAKHKRILAGATETSPEERFRRSDGSEHIIRWEVRPWYEEDNRVGGIMMLTEEITQRKRMEDQLWQLAKLDTLTGLPNRLNFNEQLAGLIEESEASSRQFAVGLIDLDRFKEINDILGHDAGDALLKEVAARLQAVFQEYGTVARLGGDEFALLISCPEGLASLDKAMAAMFEAMDAPVELGGVPRKCGMSVGITLYPDDALKPTDLLKNADLALYRAKAVGGDRFEYFAPDMRTSIERTYQLNNEVRKALSSDAFHLFYQPIVSLKAGRPVSFEALLRWRHPERGLLAPGAFEDVFSDPKVAAEIGRTVVNSALRQARAWQDSGLEFGRIAINVTSADFALGCFAERLQEKLLAYGVKPEKLCIEVTESVFLGRSAVGVAEALDKLNELGVEIAMDDFGTGFASLSHLKLFPIDRLKIDRSFVCDMEYNEDNLSIVGAIIQLGRSLGISITAEGVEKTSQLNLLRSLGCDCIQGYLFSKPLEPEAVPEFLEQLRKTSLVA